MSHVCVSFQLYHFSVSARSLSQVALPNLKDSNTFALIMSKAKVSVNETTIWFPDIAISDAVFQMGGCYSALLHLLQQESTLEKRGIEL